MDPALKEVLSTIVQTQQTLQRALTEFCKQSSPKTPDKVLTKLTAEDDVESYLELFERVATRERWPREDWAHILTPFLTGEAQQACRDLSIAEAANYTQLKAIILAQYGYSLPAKAQRVHQWAYDPSTPARPQIKTLQRLVRTWLTEGDGPAAIDRVVLDQCVRALPNDAKKYVAQQGVPDLDRLIALLENHRVTKDLIKPMKIEGRSSPAKLERTSLPRPGGNSPRRGVGELPGVRWGRSPARSPLSTEDRLCFVCGKEGHFARECPERDESMPTAGPALSSFPCGYLTTDWMEAHESAPRFPIKIMGQDTEALLDSGSVITLVCPELVKDAHGEAVAVACIHGDTKSYPTSQVRIQSPRGTVFTRVGVVPGLPVLMGRDFALFARYWNTPQQAWGVGPKKAAKPRKPPKIHQACAAPSKEGSPSSPGEEQDPHPGCVGGIPAAEPQTPEQGESSGSREGVTAERFSDFLQIHSEAPGGATEFSRKQHEDPNLAQAWKSAVFSSEEQGEEF
ncbi:uncharacterized protein LOC121678271 isoform X2 [Alosa sapidissima]|uniref:uncharacterized protein LOC121678271 isoform X2 n=1 Tax=Alosa sapidissima TaxID=34773 RepID=UPI001C0981C4|nr:uncharacterized protein LOC121678271 isoform X2 [Alosa sapidissima]